MSKFWGLTVSAGKKFKQHVPEAFCVSGAAVEPVGEDGNPVQLYMQQDDNNYLLCSLTPAQPPFQTLLNVRIGSGETVGFHLKGGSAKSKVHLTGFTLSQGGISTPTNPPFKGQQKSILVTQPKSDDKQKKRVSIVETEPYGEREMESSDDDDEEALSEIRKKLFNGDLQDSDDDDDDDDEEDDENSDSDLNEDELKELQQFKLKGKYNPKTGEKMNTEDDSDLELLENDSDEDEDDSEDDSDADNEIKKVKAASNNQQKPKEIKPHNTSLNTTVTPQKQSNNKNKDNSISGTPKTPENQALKLKTPSSAGHTPMQAPTKAYSKGGVLVNELKAGNGQAAKTGKMVAVYYSGRLKTNNKQFDSTQNGPGFKFRLGKGEVIRGWDLGVEGMKVGGKRRLTIPAQLGYGKKGAPPDIPPNSTLVFDVELKNVS